ncbi:hypothetical protein [Arthrobacter burdickii]|uniref:Uncharacterized protein n=1 Tax=Arthrobacter burdickii TaxID=3035920 RepID=A0ABT8K3F5_9MICC|nr:hypothetical protein [Arthrobacter burdickii]MDN4611960.1 hypothetical protein [Arthrobacter burdickii]
MGNFIKSEFKTTDTAAPVTRLTIAKALFNGADSATLPNTDIGGYAWNYRAGAWNVKGAALDSGDTTTFSPADCTIDPGKLNGVVSAKVLAIGAASLAGLYFRGLADGTGYVYYARGTDHVLAKRAGSNYTVIAQTGTARAFTSGEKLRVEFTGSRIICSVDGVVSHDVTDTTYATGTRVGVHTRLATLANPARWDDFLLTE